MSLQGDIAVEHAVRQILSLIDDRIITNKYRKNREIVSVLTELREGIRCVPDTTIKEKACVYCDFLRIIDEEKAWCGLANVSYKELGRVCPKEFGIQKLKESCRYHLMVKGNEVCRAHISEEGRHPCWVEALESLLTDPDFTLTKSAEDEILMRAKIEI
ncbi:MAG: hypothetical protein ABIG29_00710 [Candidatus Nealsonbacteria bacterium]